MPYEKVMFPELAIKMQEEIFLNHPKLSADLARMGNASTEERMGIVALYCGLATDGWFREKDLEKLFELVYKKLKEKSAIIVIG